MSELIKARYRYGRTVFQVGTFLKSLGIPFRRTARGYFSWEANRVHLEWIYEQMCYEARAKFNDLHPDKGGEAEEFHAFIQAFKAAKKLFAINGVSARKPLASSIRVVPKGASVFERREHRRKIKREWSRKTYPRRRESALQKSREHYWRNIDTQRKRCRDKQKRFRYEVLPTLSPEKQAAYWAKSRANSAKWTKEHRERHNELNRQYCARNTAKCTARTRRWRKNNPDKVAIQNRRRRDRRKEKKQLDLALAA